MTALILATAGVLIGVSIALILLRRTRKPDGRPVPAAGEHDGLTFVEKDNAVLDKIKFFKMYDVTTRNASAYNVYRSKNPPPDLCVFDYEATTGPESSPVTDIHTTFYFRDDRLKLPGFRLLPENSAIVRRSDSVLKYRPISFASHPVFSSRFRLAGPDGHEIGDFFTPDLRNFFEKQDDLCVEGFQSELLVYRPKRRIASREFQKYLENARAIFDLFLKRSIG
jgi:hypothetical protein